MKTYIKWNGLMLAILPSLSFAVQAGPYGEVGIGASSGPSFVVAPSSGFAGSGGTLTGGTTDVYGMNSRAVVGAYADLGYSFKRNFGIEANYTYWGQQDLSNFTGQITTATGGMGGNLSSYSFGGNLVGYLASDNDLLNIFAKLGVAGLHSSLNVNDPNNAVFFNQGSYTQSSTNAALTYGAGVQYQLNSKLSTLLSWRAITQFNNTPISNLTFNMASLGFRYTFPK